MGELPYRALRSKTSCFIDACIDLDKSDVDVDEDGVLELARLRGVVGAGLMEIAVAVDAHEPRVLSILWRSESNSLKLGNYRAWAKPERR